MSHPPTSQPSHSGPSQERAEVREREVDRFLDVPTRNLEDWRWLWEADVSFPIRSHRSGLGSVLVFFKKLLRPLFKVPLNDVFERQRVFNLILLERLEERDKLERRVSHLEATMKRGLEEVMRHNDALFGRVDQKVDAYRRESAQQSGYLKSALAVAHTERLEKLVQADQEDDYVRLENRYRGTQKEIRQRVERYLPMLSDAGSLIDLGCGRGEALALFEEHGIESHGIDASAEMVQLCHDQGLRAQAGDLFAFLAGLEAESVDAVVSFHVIEHLPPDSLGRLVALAFRALRPGGRLILETPSPLSLIAGARNFWLDPTHRRPVHPESLALAFDAAGFERVERIDLSPFPSGEHLPEIALGELSDEGQKLADRVNRLRDQLDDLLYGFQDFSVTGVKPSR